MKQIKFSHEYFKMPNNIEERKTYLIGITKINYNQLPSGYIDYDTIYSAEDDKIEHYTLPKTDLIILTLFTEKCDDLMEESITWTTIRRYTPQKYEYYKKQIGQIFEIVIEENDN